MLPRHHKGRRTREWAGQGRVGQGEGLEHQPFWVASGGVLTGPVLTASPIVDGHKAQGLHRGL